MSNFDITLDRRGTRAGAATLVEQLVLAFRAGMADGTLRAGSRLPSVRELARGQRLSTFTVLEAYGRLVSTGLVVARRGAGYRVSFAGEAGQGTAGYRIASERTGRPSPLAWEPPALNAGWLSSDVFADHSVPIKAGCGWLPGEWVNEGGMRLALRAVGRVPGARLADYGHPFGFAPLRERIVEQLGRHGLPADPNANVLLTQGATQALDLIVRTLLRAGDTVVVEDPCYCNLLQI
ncbi:MAG: aminotransferase class I/II-fold pyridoxal phosphate-dependent enzyme, partial [Janthinobacterium lividum]